VPSCLPRGFTLAESLIASVVLAIAVVGVSGALIAAQKQSQAQEDDAVAVTLARQLLEEIASYPLKFPDGSTGATGWPTLTNKSSFDTVDDFNGYRDLVATSYERERSGNGTESFSSFSAKPSSTVIAPGASLDPLTAWQYRREVSVTYPTSAFGATLSSGDLVLVTVKVSSATGRQLEISRVIAKTAVVR
jgi:prepilin-type N-terminal cleavage/methylation domain-containing protein